MNTQKERKFTPPGIYTKTEMETYNPTVINIMSEDQAEAFVAVEKINDELFQKYDKRNEKDPRKDWLSKMPVLSVTFAGGYLFISLSIPSSDTCVLPEISIYNSENNDRLFYENRNKYESYYNFIKRKFNEIKEELNAVKL